MTPLNYGGVVLDTSADAIRGPVRDALREGTYECEEIECIDLYLDEEDDVVELGAGLGFVACYVDQQLEEPTTHVVLEPNPHLMGLVERHRKANHASFETVNAAYAPDRQLAAFPLPEPFWEASLQGDHATDQTLHVGTVSLRTLLERFGLRDVALIVDIEGGEASLVEAELDVLLTHCRLLIVEFHDVAAPPELADRLHQAKAALDESAFDLLEENGTVAVYRSPDRS